MNPITELWPRLLAVKTLHFESQSRTGTGWNGVGTGTVEVTSPRDGVLIWREAGQWRQNGGREIRFTNTFRWTQSDDKITLEHLRFGEAQPVFLFQLAAIQPHEWRDVEPHLCRQDNYSAVLQIEEEGLKLSWTVFGPTRDETINYRYQ
ncbi:hypothetical protein IAD21_04831 [Abditibacteriota bacterium]|nr:hypothetical protein IAD21_04831 [Abditibacteriota bacterium]